MARKSLLFAVLALSVLVAFAGVPDRNAEGKSDFAGAESCTGCHEGHVTSYKDSVHGRNGIPGNPAAKDGCEACHGAGAAHVGKGGGKGTGLVAFSRTEDSRIRSARCLSCHEESRHTIWWNTSKHAAAGISCDDCHAGHVSAKQKLKKNEPDLCFGCHRDIRSQFSKQSHHPVREGLMKCSDCHNAHGGFDGRMLKADGINEQCYKCHAEKRGPFMWEHPPVDENCLNCHEAHGSSHSRLLLRKVPQICQSCHDSAGHPGIPYTSKHGFGGNATDDKNKMFGRSCLNCHTNVHGSTGPSSRGKIFVR